MSCKCGSSLVSVTSTNIVEIGKPHNSLLCICSCGKYHSYNPLNGATSDLSPKQIKEAERDIRGRIERKYGSVIEFPRT